MLESLPIIVLLVLVAAAFFLLVEYLPHVPGWVASKLPMAAILRPLAPIPLPGWIKLLAFGIWLLLLLFLLYGLFVTIASVLWQNLFFTAETPVEFRFLLITLTALTGVTGAVIALPFTLRRSIQSERQTRTAEEGYVTQQINESVANLAAQKEVNKIGRLISYKPVDPEESRVTTFETVDRRHRVASDIDSSTIDKKDWEPVKITEPNIEVRIGAIFALERLARHRAKTAVETHTDALKKERKKLDDAVPKFFDSGNRLLIAALPHRTADGLIDHDGARDHVRIMDILTAYIRENAPARGAAPLKLTPRPDMPKDPTEMSGPPKTYVEDRDRWGYELTMWKEAHAGPRSDIQTALRVLGRRTQAQRACEGAKPPVAASETGRSIPSSSGTATSWICATPICKQPTSPTVPTVP